jgi:ATP-dependent helicase YprA (DUF1998 family)
MTLLQIASIFAKLHDADANTMAATRRCSVVNLIYNRLPRRLAAPSIVSMPERIDNSSPKALDID